MKSLNCRTLSYLKKAVSMTRKHCCILFIGVVLCYVLPYCLLSVRGQYSERLYVSGELRYSYGLGIPDISIWNAHLVISNPYEKNALGWLFAPLVCIDRLWWHSNINVTDEIRRSIGD